MDGEGKDKTVDWALPLVHGPLSGSALHCFATSSMSELQRKKAILERTPSPSREVRSARSSSPGYN